MKTWDNKPDRMDDLSKIFRRHKNKWGITQICIVLSLLMMMTVGKLDSGFIVYKMSLTLFIHTKHIYMLKCFKAPKIFGVS